MAIIKSYTDLEQSKKLAGILPLDSADMLYWAGEYITHPYMEGQHKDEQIPIWSLAALLGVLPEPYQLTSNKEGKVQLMLIHHLEKDYYDSPVNACVEMILKLHKLNLL